jgi:hypothetical protein
VRNLLFRGSAERQEHAPQDATTRQTSDHQRRWWRVCGRLRLRMTKTRRDDRSGRALATNFQVPKSGIPCTCRGRPSPRSLHPRPHGGTGPGHTSERCREALDLLDAAVTTSPAANYRGLRHVEVGQFVISYIVRRRGWDFSY